MTSVRCPLACALTFVVTGAVMAQTPVLDVRVGLWEMTTVSQIAGDMPDLNTATMTPQQKAQFEAAMKAAMAQHTDTSKTCLTKEDLSNARFMSDDDELKCKQVFTSNTKTLLEGDVSCTGDRTMTSHMRVEAASPTSLKMAMNSTATEDGRTMKMTISMTGKWLGAACGSVQ